MPGPKKLSPAKKPNVIKKALADRNELHRRTTKPKAPPKGRRY